MLWLVQDADDVKSEGPAEVFSDVDASGYTWAIDSRANRHMISQELISKVKEHQRFVNPSEEQLGMSG